MDRIQSRALTSLGVLLSLLLIAGVAHANADAGTNLDSRGNVESEADESDEPEVNLDSKGRPERAVPEPSAALVFAAGALVAARFARKRQPR